MGKPIATPEDNRSPLTHFSHPHPLYLSNPRSAFCSACKLETFGPAYACTIGCNFILHPKCYESPQKIQHSIDQNHTLFLHPKPVYPEGLFNCDACGHQGGGFSYHCSPCGIDLHTICATLPEKMTHQCHQHELSLTFQAPYHKNNFSCDVCKSVGSKTWLYRCNICEFDVHLTCVTTIISKVTSQNQMMMHQSPQMVTTRSIPQGPQVSNHMNPPNMGGYGSGPVAMGQPQSQYGAAQGYPAAMNNQMQPGNYGSGRPVNGGGVGDQLLVGVANGVAGGIAQSVTQVMMQGMFGGGGGGGVMDGGLFYDGGGDGNGGFGGGEDGSYQ
ncbi:hypothetical protein ACJIZ3_016301 [Penstemon smallii]|uniref:DC1 domain-containing protein n=1 Tax=Penstemon smallii TaxID=265156 RepID=A0ABD3RQ69_9LAMI